MRLRGLTFRFLFCLAVIVAASSVSLRAQERERVITRVESGMVPSMNLEPGGRQVPTDVVAVEIVEIKVAGVPVTLGKPFTAGEDWLRDLTVRVRNVSPKPIIWASMHFGVPEARLARGERKSYMGFTLEYMRGRRPKEGAPEMKLLMPGEEAELVCFAESYTVFRQQAEKESQVKSISTLQTGGDLSVVFEDNVSWHGSNLDIGGDAGPARKH